MILMRGSILDEIVRKGGCDEIGGKKFPMPLSGAEVFTLLYFTYSLPTRSKEKEEGRNKLD